MLQRKLPPGLRDLVNLGLGFYVAVTGIVLFCNWNVPQRTAVIAVMIMGGALAYLGSQVFSGLALLLLRKRSVNNKSGEQ